MSTNISPDLASTGPVRFVAVGDSFTEGVGDRDLRLPNDCRGWTDRVAEELTRNDPRTRYANLAVRGRRLRRIVDEQLDAALAMEPTLVSFHAGGNDLLAARLDLGALIRDDLGILDHHSLVHDTASTTSNIPIQPSSVNSDWWAWNI